MQIHSTFPVVFVTSFQVDMYRATGIHLIESFVAHVNGVSLLVCTENLEEGMLNVQHPQLWTHDITRNCLLHEWLTKNADIIPKHLGGFVDPCTCPTSGIGVEELHRPGCNYFWFNRNASRWFRKLVALRVASEKFPICKLIWLDSDCRFKRHLNERTVASWFAGCSVFYFRGQHRKVLDSGVLGIDLASRGDSFLDEVLRRYTSGIFRQDRRWDDAFQFQIVVDQMKHLKLNDMALSGHAHWRGDVVGNSLVGKHIDHYKGVHGAALRLMT